MFFLVLASAAVVALLFWSLFKRFSADRIRGFNDARRESSRLVSRGEFIDSGRHVQVALALSESAFYYENADMQASLDLEMIQEVEYESELSTGQSVVGGKVLRLRCSSKLFEFILPADAIRQWQAILPAHRLSEVSSTGS